MNGGWTRSADAEERLAKLVSASSALLAAILAMIGSRFGEKDPGRQFCIKAGIACAVVSAIAGVYWAWRANDRNTRSEQAKRSATIEACLVCDAQPATAGVRPISSTARMARDFTASYVPRADADQKLDDALANALGGQPRAPWMIVITGPAAVGKSRTLYEALRRYDVQARRRNGEARGLLLLVPRSDQALRDLIDPAKAAKRHDGPTVLLLDKLTDTDEGVLQQWHRAGRWRKGCRDRIVVATNPPIVQSLILHFREKQVLDADFAERQVLRKIRLRETSRDELDPVRSHFTEEQFEAAARHGLAAYLTAPVELSTRLDNADSTDPGYIAVQVVAD